MNNNFKQIGLLIPALEPDQRLIALLHHIVTAQFAGPILVVDDGTVDQTIFNQIQVKFGDRVVIRHHPHNLGKGAALKTGFT